MNIYSPGRLTRLCPRTPPLYSTHS